MVSGEIVLYLMAFNAFNIIFSDSHFSACTRWGRLATIWGIEPMGQRTPNLLEFGFFKSNGQVNPGSSNVLVHLLNSWCSILWSIYLKKSLSIFSVFSK